MDNEDSSMKNDRSTRLLLAPFSVVLTALDARGGAHALRKLLRQLLVGQQRPVRRPFLHERHGLLLHLQPKLFRDALGNQAVVGIACVITRREFFFCSFSHILSSRDSGL